MKRIMSALLVLCLLMFSGIETVSANGMPFYRDYEPPAGNVLPLDDHRISMDGEQLTVKFRKEDHGSLLDPANPSLRAQVNVLYRIHNQTTDAIDVPIAFPHPGATSQWKVSLDGREVPLTKPVNVPKDKVTDGSGSIFNHWFHPRTGEEYHLDGANPIYSFVKAEDIISNTFTVSLQGSTTHDLLIEYESKTGIDEGTRLHPVYRFDYLLHPASYWSSFKDLTIRIEVPFGSKLFTNLPLQKLDSHNLEGHFDSLPTENLAVFLSPDSGLFIDLFNSEGMALGFVLLLSLSFYPLTKILASYVAPRRRMPVLIAITVVYLWVGYDILSHKIIGYPFHILQPAMFLLYLLMLRFGWRKLLHAMAHRQREQVNIHHGEDQHQ